MGSPAREPPGRLRTLALRAALLPLLWTLFELLLALFGVGGAERAGALLPYQNVAYPLFVAHDAPGGARYVAHEERLGARTFAREKPPGLVRVFCLGGSAMRGLGYSPNVSIPGTLERTLATLGVANRPLEVLNCGVIGLSSRQIRGMCEDVVARYAPDLVIVCSGNNEFLELHARKYQELQDAGLGRAFLAWVRDLRSFHLLRSWLPKRAAIGPSDSGEIRLTASEFIQEVEITEAEIQSTLAEYRTNLDGIAAACTRAQVPLVLMTVPANLRWNDPHPEEDWDERLLTEWNVERGSWPATRAERLARIHGELEQRLVGASSSALTELAFLKGKCEEELGDLAAARDSYVMAQDADPHRRRTTTAMNAIVSSVAAAHGAELFDTVAFFRELESIPDFRLMYDHIHTTPEGALWIAGALAEETLRLLHAGSAEVPTQLATFRTEELARLAARIGTGEDYPEADAWIGFNFDPEMMADRDLWKYHRQLQKLRTITAKEGGPTVPLLVRGKALTFLGNALSFDAGGADEARACYEEALTLVPEWEAALRSNLARLGE